MAVEKQATVTWSGSLAEGSGTIESVTSGAVSSLGVDWQNRAEGAHDKTSPEELIAAAHASCFSMALSAALAKADHAVERLETTATVEFIGGTGITKSALDVRGSVPGIDDAAFREFAEQAKENCPVSKALSGNVELSVDARLE